jgi:3-oxoacyl-[acyl-carrier protein] reductase
MKVIRGKKALVTGAASGIGRSIALALAREGADLFLLDNNAEKLSRVVDEARAHGTEIIGRECDVGRPNEIGASVAALKKTWGRLDILINNAGVIYHGDTEKMTDAQWERLLAINLHAPLLFIRRLLPLLLAQGDAHILNVCSIYGLVPKRKLAAYQTSKHALVGLSRSLRCEYGGAGLGVTALCPGFVDTNLLAAARDSGWSSQRFHFPSFLSMSPDRVAARAVRAIYKNKGLVVVGGHARILWAAHRLWPRI